MFISAKSPRPGQSAAQNALPWANGADCLFSFRTFSRLYNRGEHQIYLKVGKMEKWVRMLLFQCMGKQGKEDSARVWRDLGSSRTSAFSVLVAGATKPPGRQLLTVVQVSSPDVPSLFTRQWFKGGVSQRS